jgi:PhnB protein
MRVEPYLFFDGRCEEALNFYKTALGAKVEMMLRYKEHKEALENAPQNAEKIMHSTMRVGDTAVHLSDGHCAGKPKFEGFAVSLNVATAAESEKYFKVLSDGGEVRMPLSKTFFSSSFGMVTDRFGVMWMVIVGQ